MWLGPLKARPMTQRSGGPAVTQGVWGSHRLVATPGAASAGSRPRGPARPPHAACSPVATGAAAGSPTAPLCRAGLSSQGAALGSGSWRARPASALVWPDPEAGLRPSLALIPQPGRLSEFLPPSPATGSGSDRGHCSRQDSEGPRGWSWAPWDFRPPGPWPLLAGPRCPSAGPWSGRRKGRERASAGPL